MSSRAMTKVMRSAVVGALVVSGAVLAGACAGGGGELTPEAAAAAIRAHPEFENPPNLAVYQGATELMEITNITPEGGSRARVEFKWRYDRNFMGTTGNVPSTLYYTRLLDKRVRDGEATLVESGGQWTVESLSSLWESMRESTPVSSTTYDDPR